MKKLLIAILLLAPVTASAFCIVPNYFGTPSYSDYMVYEACKANERQGRQYYQSQLREIAQGEESRQREIRRDYERRQREEKEDQERWAQERYRKWGY